MYIKTYKSRYLHLDVKAYLENGVNDLGTNNEQSNLENIFKDYFIDQEIRVFPNEVYYFDHPKFGVVISIKDKP